mgnify:CR=1 FL=1
MGYDCPRVQIISEVPGRRTIHATYRLWPWDEAWWAGAVVAAIEQVLDAFNFHLLVYVNDQGEADVVARHPPSAHALAARWKVYSRKAIRAHEELVAALAIDPDGVTGPAHDIAMALVARDVVESLANEKVRSVIAAYQAVRFTRSLYSVYR